MRDKNVIDATGKAMDQWYALLDESGAREMPHKEIAESLCGMGVEFWWAQTISGEYEKHIGRRVLGQMSDGSFQLGVRRSMPVGSEDLWREVRAQPELWHTREGRAGEETTLVEGSHFRMRWGEADWPRPSILQLRVLPASRADESVLSVHQEKIPSAELREELITHWKSVLAALHSRLQGE
jgi:hypothetical protein